ncbi:smalltalk protein [Xylanibacter ruminicola]|nr:smalltalk protein [Xylanibacter ruminicola]
MFNNAITPFRSSNLVRDVATAIVTALGATSCMGAM